MSDNKSRREKISDSFSKRPSLMDRIKSAVSSKEDEEDSKKGPKLDEKKTKGFMAGFKKGY